MLVACYRVKIIIYDVINMYDGRFLNFLFVNDEESVHSLRQHKNGVLYFRIQARSGKIYLEQKFLESAKQKKFWTKKIPNP